MGEKLKIKTMCRLGKSLSGEALEVYFEAVRKPRFFCEKCYRVARRKKHLCRPVDLPKKESEP